MTLARIGFVINLLYQLFYRITILNTNESFVILTHHLKNIATGNSKMDQANAKDADGAQEEAAGEVASFTEFDAE